MFVTMHAIDGVRDAHLLIGCPLGGGHQPQCLTSLNHPLPLLTIANHITFNVIGVIVLAVSSEVSISLVV